MHKDRLLDYIHNIFLVKQRVDEEVAQSNGLSPLDVHILTFLEVNADDPTATDIEHRHKIKKNTISVHVDNLVRSGYLVRQYSADDRRKVILSCTDTGKLIARQCFAECEHIGAQLREGLTDDDVATICRCLETINRNALRLLGD